MTATYPLMRQAVERGNYMLREEAIKKHRAMWTWIAEQIVTNEHTMNIAMLKQMYIKMQCDDTEKMDSCNNCYLCCYTEVDCRECPLLWPSDSIDFKCEYGYRSTNGYSDGLYYKCCKLYYDRNLHYECGWELQVTLCRKIANLPEREMSK